MTSAGELRRRSLDSLTRPSYSIASGDMALLNDNANLYGVNPAAVDVARSFDFAKLWAYPSESSEGLRARIASELSVSPDEVIVGNGSDELLDIISKCFIDPGDLFASPSPTFGMYKFYARVNHAEVREHLLRPDFSLDATPLLEDGAKLMAVCQPNNPTANLFERSELMRLIRRPGGMTILDEAYSDFSGSDMLKDAMSSESCIDTRTFSKAYGIAGLRVGFAVSRKDVIDELRRVRTPFGLNSFSEAVAISALDNKGWVRDSVSRMRSDRDYLSSRMRALGFDVKPSVCNFVIGRSPVDGPGLVAALRSEGVAVRDCSTFPMLEGFIRVTVGPRPLLDRFLEAAEGIIGGGRA